MSSSGFSKILSNEVRMEQDVAQDEEDSEDARQDPSWTRDAVEHSVVETDFIHPRKDPQKIRMPVQRQASLREWYACGCRQDEGRCKIVWST